jgi:hypothetical protein
MPDPGVNWADVAGKLLMPLALAYAGHQGATAIKEREINANYVSLAIGILQGPPSDERYDLRDWAASIISRFSGEPLSEVAKQALIRTAALSVDQSTVPRGTTDSPAPGSVSLPSSAQPDSDVVTVPNVRGLTTREAVEALRQAGLAAPSITAASDTARVDLQSLPAGTRVRRGAAVSVIEAPNEKIPPSRIRPALTRRP